MKKTICLILDHRDACWIDDYFQNKSQIEDITIVAPTFEGQLIAVSKNLPYKTYEEEAWRIDENTLYDVSRVQAHRWHQLQEIKENPYLEAVRDFNDYPLLVMHQNRLMLSIYEILQAREFIIRLFEIEQPDKVVVGQRENPFNKKTLFWLTGSNGLEREAARALSSNYHIEFIEMSNKSAKIPNKIVKAFRDPKLIFRMAVSVLKDSALKSTLSHIKPQPQFVWNSELTGNKILFFAWGGDYYLKQFSETFDLLLREKTRIGLVITGGKLIPDEERTYRQKGICVIYKSDWFIKKGKTIFNEWKNKGLEAFKSISKSDTLKNYFSDSAGSYFPGLVDEAIKNELGNKSPITVGEILCSESIINAVEPDLVVAHFAHHPLGSCDVLPARLSGIPTLTLCHGIGVYANSVRDTFSTQYYAVIGDSYKYALMQSLKCSDDAVISVGESRLDKIFSQKNIQEAKANFGFNPYEPLCIFCDCSGGTLSLEWRHTTFKTIEQILNLKNRIPNLQIIYRVHHGADYSQMKEYFDTLDIPDITFQISLSPLFTDIVQAADVVISHHTSAITEALLSGVRVIYLCALSQIEPIYLNCEAIKVQDNFESLPEVVKSIIENPMLKENVMAMCQPYFDRVLCGNDGKATERLAQVILKLSRTPKARWKKGFQDWVDRIDASCEFRSENWNAYKIFKKQLSL